MLPKHQPINGIYLHFPFCRSICSFCGFPILPNQPKKHDDYLRYLHKETELLIDTIRPDFSKVSSVYLGGGTPSLLPINQLTTLSQNLKTLIGHQSSQWSIEINPEDGNYDYLEQLMALGFNRFSVGVQSFNSTVLELISRNHKAHHCFSVLNHLQQLHVSDFNIDIMFGIPGQTLGDTEKDLYTALEYHPTHISAYILNIEPKTKLSRKPDWLKWQEDHEKMISSCYLKVIDILSQNGLAQYEVSNFAKSGFESIQNIINWSGKNYLGIGMGAHSFIDNCRWGNFRRWKEYRDSIEKNQLPWDFLDQLSFSQKRDEYLMINLRLVNGLDLTQFSNKFQCHLQEYCHKQIEQLLNQELMTLQNNRLKLSSSGMLLADEITVNLCAMLPD